MGESKTPEVVERGLESFRSLAAVAAVRRARSQLNIDAAAAALRETSGL